jgi:hypothetical protein
VCADKEGGISAGLLASSARCIQRADFFRTFIRAAEIVVRDVVFPQQSEQRLRHFCEVSESL